jgi:hypothetical protein
MQMKSPLSHKKRIAIARTKAKDKDPALAGGGIGTALYSTERESRSRKALLLQTYRYLVLHNTIHNTVRVLLHSYPCCACIVQCCVLHGAYRYGTKYIISKSVGCCCTCIARCQMRLQLHCTGTGAVEYRKLPWLYSIFTGNPSAGLP